MAKQKPLEKSPEFLEIRDIIAEEQAKIAKGGRAEVFYHPGQDCNGFLTGDVFVPNGIPAGFELDRDAWNAAGRRGAAPIREVGRVVEEAAEAGPEPEEEPEAE